MGANQEIDHMDKRICIKGGRVFFSEKKIMEKKDIFISNGKILSIEDEFKPDNTTKIIDAKNKLVTPGLIDFHMHAF